jgi:hypothetical protein
MAPKKSRKGPAKTLSSERDQEKRGGEEQAQELEREAREMDELHLGAEAADGNASESSGTSET